jgi:hypothetical protein
MDSREEFLHGDLQRLWLEGILGLFLSAKCEAVHGWDRETAPAYRAQQNDEAAN